MFLSEGFGLEDTQCALQVSDSSSSLLRELFEAQENPTHLISDQDFSLFPKPQLSTVNVNYITQEYPNSKATPRLPTPCKCSVLASIYIKNEAPPASCQSINQLNACLFHVTSLIP